MSAGAPELMQHPLADGHGPAWATEWGEDPEFGPFAVLECPSKDGRPPVRVRWRWIPAGEFEMGSPESESGRDSDEGPVHRVRLNRGFWMMSTVCTQSFWEAVLGKAANRSHFRGGDRPVENVSWEDVKAFVLGLESDVPGLGASLPTEAQWEYACRAGSPGTLYRVAGHRQGDSPPEAKDLAWYAENSRLQTHPVGEKLPNYWGLYDMLGNVWEWCLDGQRPYTSASVVDPVGPSVESRVIRGGCWNFYARYARCAYRRLYSPEIRDYGLGFRLVRVQD